MTTKPQRRERVAGKVIPFTQPSEMLGVGLSLANEKAEQAVLGSVLSNGELFPTLADILEAGDFYFLFNAFVWWAYEEISAEGGCIDLVTVASKLTGCAGCPLKGHELDTGLAQLVACTPRDGQAEYYARLVFDAATRLRCLAATEKIRAVAVNTTLPIEAVKDQVNSAIFEATDQRAQLRTDMASIAGAYGERVKHIRETGHSPGVVSGFKDLDALTHGFFPGEVTVIAAKAGVGKTTLLLSMLRNIVQRGQRVVHFSTEMSQEEIIRIFVAMETGISTTLLKSGQLSESQYRLFENALALIADWPLHIIDEFNPLTPLCIRRKTRAIQVREPVDLVSVDGLWEMEPDTDSGDKRYRDVAKIIKDLTTIASIKNGLAVPMIVIHQLKQEQWKKGETPTLYHLAESAAVGRTAQVALVLARESDLEWEERDVTQSDIVNGYLVKDRNGTAQGKQTRFYYDLEHHCYTGDGYVVF